MFKDVVMDFIIHFRLLFGFVFRVPIFTYIPVDHFFIAIVPDKSFLYDKCVLELVIFYEVF
jgi:hypothetical protein